MRTMLMLVDREVISRGLAEGLEYKDIALRLGRDPSVISRDVSRHGGRGGYRAAAAHETACAARERPKVFAVERSPRLRASGTPRTSPCAPARVGTPDRPRCTAPIPACRPVDGWGFYGSITPDRRARGSDNQRSPFGDPIRVDSPAQPAGTAPPTMSAEVTDDRPGHRPTLRCSISCCRPPTHRSS